MKLQIATERYRGWLQDNITLTDPLSPSSLKELVYCLLLGKNYRVITEINTKAKLLITYAWLLQVYEESKKEYGEEWRLGLLKRLTTPSPPAVEEKDLAYWLVGLTRKTAQNLDVSPEEFPGLLKQTIEYSRELFIKMGCLENEEQAWLLLAAGAATLNIRGSQKSAIGKALEKVFLKASLTLLGLEYCDDFHINLRRDVEVARETDAEVKTRRGSIRIDIGLIAEGNPEVIADKINRVDRLGIVIFDKIGSRAQVVHESAREKGVKLIQIRHNQPLVELYRHLQPLVDKELTPPPSDEKHLRTLLTHLADDFFVIT